MRVRTRSVSDSCVGRAFQMFVEYYTVFARMRRRARYVSDSSVIVNDTCAVYARFVSNVCPRHPTKFGQFLDTQARTNPICA